MLGGLLRHAPQEGGGEEGKEEAEGELEEGHMLIMSCLKIKDAAKTLRNRLTCFFLPFPFIRNKPVFFTNIYPALIHKSFPIKKMKFQNGKE